MLKMVLALVLALALFVSVCAGCGNKAKGVYYGDAPGKDTLRVCVDSWRTDWAQSEREKDSRAFFEALAVQLKEACGIEKIAFEMLPQSSVERKTALQRLRTEIMAGDGPDLFIVQTTCNAVAGEWLGQYENAIFNYPEKSMEVGLFLPLDEYMENNTQFTDWDKQTQAVMAAGRSSEGQVLIPMTYDMPMLIYKKDEADIPYKTDLTRQEILDDPETADLGAVLYSTLGGSSKPNSFQSPVNPIRDSLGRYADYEKEELLFTEEELYAITNEAYQMQKTVIDSEWPFYMWSEGLTTVFAEDMKNATEMELVPRYNKDGGVTARVTAFMAVSRTTKLPEEAFSVLDYLMQENMQSASDLYSIYFCDGFPMQNDLGSEEKPWNVERGNGDFLSSQHMEELLGIKEQITAVNIESDMDVALRAMTMDLNHISYQNTGKETEIPREVISQIYEKMERAVKE